MQSDHLIECLLRPTTLGGWQLVIFDQFLTPYWIKTMSHIPTGTWGPKKNLQDLETKWPVEGPEGGGIGWGLTPPPFVNWIVQILLWPCYLTIKFISGVSPKPTCITWENNNSTPFLLVLVWPVWGQPRYPSVTDNSTILNFNPLTTKLFNFHRLEVVVRWHDPQLQVVKIIHIDKMNFNYFQILLIDVTFYL